MTMPLVINESAPRTRHHAAPIRSRARDHARSAMICALAPVALASAEDAVPLFRPLRYALEDRGQPEQVVDQIIIPQTSDLLRRARGARA